MTRRPRHRQRALARALHQLPAPCCPQVTFDETYAYAQGAHQRAQAADPGHDRLPSVCCCWDCRGWERAEPRARL